jgi:hypothetical protein
MRRPFRSPDATRIGGAGVASKGQDGEGHSGPREDDVTDPGYPTEVPEADRAEQEALLDASAVASTADAVAPGDGVPEADALEQQLAARPEEADSPLEPVGDREADDADVLEQNAAVPLDDDHDRG